MQSFIPIVAEYMLPLGKGLSLSFGLGPEFLIRPEAPPPYPYGGINEFGSFFVIQQDGTKIGYTYEASYKEGWLYVGASASVGLNIKTGPLLLRPTLTFHYQPEAMYTYVATTQNLMVSENTVSTHEITGNYLMFSVSIIPSRDLFRGNKKAE